MADTLININQNQLNTQNGSFTELIKSTQQGKEKLATALVDKGANVSSSSTLSDMATAVNNIISFDGLNPLIGDIVNGDNTQYMSGLVGGAYKLNDKGFFYITLLSTTSIRIFNLTPDLYVNNSNTAFFKDISVPTICTGNFNNNQPLYVSHDATTIFYVGSDHQTVYKCTVDYSGVATDTPTNFTLTYDTYVAQSQFHSSYAQKVVAYNSETNDVVLWQPNSSNLSSTYGGTFKKFNLQTLVTTDMSHNIPSTGNTWWFGSLSTDAILYNSYTNSSIAPIFSIVKIDYTNNTLSTYSQINFNTQQMSSGYVYQYGTVMYENPVITIHNNQYMSIIANFANTSYLILININDYTYTVYPSGAHYYNFGVSGASTMFPGCPTIIGDTVYIVGGVCGQLWKITYEDGMLVVNSNDVLFYANYYTTLNGFNYICGICVYGERNSLSGNEGLFICFINSSGNGGGSAGSQGRITKVLYTNQVIGYEYKNGSGESVLLLPRPSDYTQAFSGALNLPEADVLVEDN